MSICTICFEKVSPTSAAGTDACDHVMCFECIQRWASVSSTCPSCRAPFGEIIRHCDGEKCSVEEKTLELDDIINEAPVPADKEKWNTFEGRGVTIWSLMSGPTSSITISVYV